MVNYCGEDCAIVNANGPIEEVVERIESVIGKVLIKIQWLLSLMKYSPKKFKKQLRL